ncbi:MAG TPA: TetR/AcrR family transcriptional regulator [Gaiellaceae bacterium]|nr:TetR/AcrR family transcriptional regulator [Gaiellaceae bacterium]
MSTSTELTPTGASTEERILGAATVLFSEKGYHATTMREVAAAVGIKAGSLYNHYASKEDLLFRIARGVMEELLEGGRDALAVSPQSRDQLAELVRRHVLYHAEHRFRAKIADDQLNALTAARRATVIGVRDAYERLWRDVIEAGRTEHGWVVPDVPVVTFAVTTMCTAVDVWYREEGRLTPAEIADIYVELVLGALERNGAVS